MGRGGAAAWVRKGLGLNLGLGLGLGFGLRGKGGRARGSYEECKGVGCTAQPATTWPEQRRTPISR